MDAKQLSDFIEVRRERAGILLQDAAELEREANLARRTATDFISEVAYARIKLRRSEQA
jgi:hypothetical protein